jgi:hypothetical protein
VLLVSVISSAMMFSVSFPVGGGDSQARPQIQPGSMPDRLGRVKQFVGPHQAPQTDLLTLTRKR